MGLAVSKTRLEIQTDRQKQNKLPNPLLTKLNKNDKRAMMNYFNRKYEYFIGQLNI